MYRNRINKYIYIYRKRIKIYNVTRGNKYFLHNYNKLINYMQYYI